MLVTAWYSRSSGWQCSLFGRRPWNRSSEMGPHNKRFKAGLRGAALPMALLYGMVKTGFSEELLFRGLIAGSFSRQFSILGANLGQALIFLVPHLLVLRIMPEVWGILPIIFASSLFLGWVRIRSGSIIGPWLIHAFANVAICLSVAVRTAP